MKLTAEEVLREHQNLAERLLYPDEPTTEYAAAFARDKGLKERGRDVNMMFYPYDMSSEKGPREFMQGLGRSLAQARDYQVTEPMMELAEGLFKEEAKSTVHHLDEREMPAEHGFMWFDRPAQQTDLNGLKVATSAVSWGVMPVLMPQADGKPPQWERGVRLTFWTSWDVPEGTDSYTDDFYAEAARRGETDRETTKSRLVSQFGNLTFSHTVMVPFGVRFDVSEAGFGDPVIVFIHIIWMLMDMEMVTSSAPGHVQRNARRRALRSLKHGEVNVIMLRRGKPLADEGYEPVPGYVNWSCRWIVQGHWRNFKDGKRTWVRPYIKGPDGLPIKDSKQLWRLAR